VSKGWGYIHF